MPAPIFEGVAADVGDDNFGFVAARASDDASIGSADETAAIKCDTVFRANAINRGDKNSVGDGMSAHDCFP